MKKIVFIFMTAMLFSLVSNAQTERVSGTITDDKGVGISGATISIINSSVVTVTDENGKYTIAIPTNLLNQKLSVTHINYQPQTVNITSNTVNIILSSTQQQMSEVVVIGYGTQKKRNVTGAVASLNTDFEERPVQRVDQALVGQ